MMGSRRSKEVSLTELYDIKVKGTRISILPYMSRFVTDYLLLQVTIVIRVVWKNQQGHVMLVSTVQGAKITAGPWSIYVHLVTIVNQEAAMNLPAPQESTRTNGVK